MVINMQQDPRRIQRQDPFDTTQSKPNANGVPTRSGTKNGQKIPAARLNADRFDASVNQPLTLSQAEMQRRRKILYIRRKRYRRRMFLLVLICLLLIALLIFAAVLSVRHYVRSRNTVNETDTVPSVVTEPDTAPVTATPPTASQTVAIPYTAAHQVNAIPITPMRDEQTVQLTDDEISCKYAMLVNSKTGKIEAEKNGGETIYPASMTKLMTVLVAYENIPDLNATFRMTNEIIDPLYLAELSLAGFSGNEDVVIWDLLYGSALPSGAEASVALAIAACETEDAFVQKMNERAASLGMTGTHFVNCTGEHNENHYSTLSDIAILMNFVMQNEDLYKIFSTYQHTTTPTKQHPEGILLTSTVFSRMEGNESLTCTVVGGKTGYTVQAQQCLATYAVKNETGDIYVCVTAGGDTKWRPVYDSIYLYQYYT
ncbi:MAG: D-alanyl-D-alanine carboxypeptidase [Clostridia bacterium]|nr:D-alanyl-D-alanine carboxypeptidase [Clostridia bacterium]